MNHFCSSTVTGTALGGNYSLRSTLGLQASDAPVTKSFQQGNVNGYASTFDGGVPSGAPTTNYATAGFIALSASTSGRMLIRFDNLFGSGSSQIPYGSKITSASLKLYQSGTGLTGATLRMHRVLVEWPETATFNSVTTSGAGIQFDEVEVRAAPDASAGNLANGVTKTFQGAAVTATVQAWANGAPNYGWAFWQDSTANCNLTLSNNSVSVPVHARRTIAPHALVGFGQPLDIQIVVQRGQPLLRPLASDLRYPSLFR